mgnify:CR=1 FL=1
MQDKETLRKLKNQEIDLDDFDNADQLQQELVSSPTYNGLTPAVFNAGVAIENTLQEMKPEDAFETMLHTIQLIARTAVDGSQNPDRIEDLAMEFSLASERLDIAAHSRRSQVKWLEDITRNPIED